MAAKKTKVDIENSRVAKRSDYTNVLDAIVAGGFCPFCEEHLFKHHRNPLLRKSKYWLVTQNAWPYEGSKHHFLFIARPHVESSEQLPPSMWSDLQRLYRQLVKDHAIKGGTLMLRSGDTAYTGASVSHLHAHLVVGRPRSKTTKPITALIGFKK